MLRKLKADESRLLPFDLFDDDLVRRLRIGLIEHHTFVAGVLEHGGKRHDADGRESHHSNIAVLGASFCREGIELWIADVDQKDSQQTPWFDLDRDLI